MPNNLFILDNLSGREKDSDIGREYASEIRKRLRALLLKGRIIVVSRDSNLDGLVAPALMMRIYGIGKKDVILTQQAEYKELERRLREMKPNGCSFVFSDLGVSSGDPEAVVRISRLLRSNGNNVIWLDHHPWDDIIINNIGRYTDYLVCGESSMYCASEITHSLLCKKGKEEARLAALAHSADFPDAKSGKMNRLELLARAITYTRTSKGRESGLLSIVESLSRLEVEGKFITNAALMQKKVEERSTSVLLRNSHVVELKKARMGIGFSNGLNANYACAVLMKRLGCRIAIYIDTKTGKSGIRSARGIDSSAIARAMGGGGHPQASGFYVKPLSVSSKIGMKNAVKRIGSMAINSNI